jgi:DegV family protein with EDD domain
MQNEVVHNRKSDIALLTDSTCDLPQEILDRYQIHVAPLSVHFGENYYLDRLTIQPEMFYKMLSRSHTNPTSSQPSGQDLVNRYEYLSTHYKGILAVHISQGMSGTWSNSFKSAEEVMSRTGIPSHVVNSKTLTGGLGLLVLRVARAIEAGASMDEIIPRVEEWVAKGETRVTVPTLKYIVRSGRVSAFKGFIAKALDLKPIIKMTHDTGKAELFSKSFTMKGSMKKTIRDIQSKIKGKTVWEYSITHANNPEAADWFAVEMEKLTGKKPVFVASASPVLAAHVGPGVTCVSLMME